MCVWYGKTLLVRTIYNSDDYWWVMLEFRPILLIRTTKTTTTALPLSVRKIIKTFYFRRNVIDITPQTVIKMLVSSALHIRGQGNQSRLLIQMWKKCAHIKWNVALSHTHTHTRVHHQICSSTTKSFKPRFVLRFRSFCSQAEQLFHLNISWLS